MKYFLVCIIVAIILNVFVCADKEDDDTFNLKELKSMRLRTKHESKRRLSSLRGLSNAKSGVSNSKNSGDDDYLFARDDDYLVRDDDNFGDDQNDDDMIPNEFDTAMNDDFWGNRRRQQ